MPRRTPGNGLGPLERDLQFVPLGNLSDREVDRVQRELNELMAQIQDRVSRDMGLSVPRTAAARPNPGETSILPSLEGLLEIPGLQSIRLVRYVKHGDC